MKIVVRWDKHYWRWGWLGPYATFLDGLIYPWRLGLGPIQFRGTVSEEFRVKSARLRRVAVRKAEIVAEQITRINKPAGESLHAAVDSVKRVWELK